jgi:hypothetical protein
MLGSSGILVGPFGRGAGAVGKVASWVCGLVSDVGDTGARTGAGENSSETGSILPATSGDIAIMGSMGALRCQEGGARLRLWDETPPLVKYAWTAGPRVLTTALMRSAVGLARAWR